MVFGLASQVCIVVVSLSLYFMLLLRVRLMRYLLNIRNSKIIYPTHGERREETDADHADVAVSIG